MCYLSPSHRIDVLPRITLRQPLRVTNVSEGLPHCDLQAKHATFVPPFRMLGCVSKHLLAALISTDTGNLLCASISRKVKALELLHVVEHLPASMPRSFAEG